MDSNKGRCSVEMMARALNISPRSYDNYKQERYTARIERKEYLLSMVCFKSTTNSNHTYNIAPNLLNREFQVDEPSKVWVGDITYIHTKDGFIYLTTVIDLFDRKVIGWSISRNLKT
ncbi:MAG: DDE-type integrase/transposase/recombinase [Bacteroidales bacterium]